jgi:ATP-binding cassette, subfamily G (WHITE), member 2, PDR
MPEPNRNLAILIGMMVFFFIAHLVASEYILAQPSKGEMLVFRHGARAESDQQKGSVVRGKPFEVNQQPLVAALPVQGQSEEAPTIASRVIQQAGCFHWSNISCEVKAKRGSRQILRGVSGWVQPGTLTALMVCSMKNGVLRSILLISFSIPGCHRGRQNISSQCSSEPNFLRNLEW